MSRPFQFGDVVEWDIENQRVIRWFIVSGEPGDYLGVNIAMLDRHGGWLSLEHDGVQNLGVQALADSDYRLLTDE